MDNLLRYTTPTEILSRYTVSMLDAQGRTLSSPGGSHAQPRLSLPWIAACNP